MLAGLLLSCAAVTASAQERFQLAAQADALVLRFSEEPGEIEDPEPGPSLEVYADGLAVVHYPAYMKKAGTYEVRLRPAELRDLVRTLVEANLVEFDPAAVRELRRQADRQAPLQASSDAERLHFELNLEDYSPRGARAAQRGAVRKRVTWNGLRRDAERLAHVPEIRDLDTCRRALEGVMRHPGLEAAE